MEFLCLPGMVHSKYVLVCEIEIIPGIFVFMLTLRNSMLVYYSSPLRLKAPLLLGGAFFNVHWSHFWRRSRSKHILSSRLRSPLVSALNCCALLTPNAQISKLTPWEIAFAFPIILLLCLLSWRVLLSKLGHLFVKLAIFLCLLNGLQVKQESFISVYLNLLFNPSMIRNNFKVLNEVFHLLFPFFNFFQPFILKMLLVSMIIVVYIIKVFKHLLKALTQLNILLSRAHNNAFRLVFSCIRSSYSSSDRSFIFTLDAYLLLLVCNHHFLIFCKWNFYLQLALFYKLFNSHF